MTPLITPAQLRSRLGEAGLVVLDATYYLPNEGKNAAALYTGAKIPGAAFFDVDKIADTESGLPHMLPAPARFAEQVAALGVSSSSHVVVYDQVGLFSAARAWWMFRVFGHDNVQVLDGGLPGWIAAGGAVTSTPVTPAPGDFTPSFRPEMVRSLENMRQNLTTGAEQILDARGAGRFHGTVPEPRAGMRSGHIPGAVSLPFTEILRDGALLPADELRAVFNAKGITPESRVVASCGSGVTAAVLALGLVVADLPEAAIYDGSWSEWGGRSDTPIEV